MSTYSDYMKDYMLENMSDVCDLYPLMEEYKNELLMEANKEDVYKINYIFKNDLQLKFIHPVLESNSNRNKLIEFTGRFIDAHAQELSASGPIYQFTFGDRETRFLYELFGIDNKVILEIYDKVVQETYYGKISKFITGWIQNAPHKILLTAILCEAVQQNYEDIIECIACLWPFSEYPILYRISFPLGVNEDVMNYTIEHLGAKYKIRKVKNLQELLVSDGRAAVNHFTDILKTGQDNVYVDIMQYIRNSLKSKIQNIAKIYYINIEKNASQHANATVFDDGNLNDVQGGSVNIAQIIEKITNKFSGGDINKSIVNICANGNQVDKDNLFGFITNIEKDKNNKFNKFVENIITSYFSKNPSSNSLGTSEFINYGLLMYRSISNSKDPLFQEIKEILNYWMFTIIKIDELYKRVPTQIAYTRAIYNYYIMMINYYN